MEKKINTEIIVNDYISNLIRKQTIVKSQEYLDWLITFVKNRKNTSFNDEDVLYDDSLTLKDKENASLISFFYSYITKLADEQSVFPNENMEDEIYYFSYNDEFYEIWTIIAQGAITGISLCKEIIPEDYVIIGRELTNEEKKEKELIEYIVVNVDLKMSAGKIATQVGHVCGMCAEKQSQTHKYEVWKQLHDFKKITLAGHQKTLESLEKQGFFAVRDKGYTEIPENSLTAVSLGIMTRKEASLFIKRLQLFK